MKVFFCIKNLFRKSKSTKQKKIPPCPRNSLSSSITTNTTTTLNDDTAQCLHYRDYNWAIEKALIWEDHIRIRALAREIMRLVPCHLLVTQEYKEKIVPEIGRAVTEALLLMVLIVRRDRLAAPAMHTYLWEEELEGHLRRTRENIWSATFQSPRADISAIISAATVTAYAISKAAYCVESNWDIQGSRLAGGVAQRFPAAAQCAVQDVALTAGLEDWLPICDGVFDAHKRRDGDDDDEDAFNPEAWLPGLNKPYFQGGEKERVGDSLGEECVKID